MPVISSQIVSTSVQVDGRSLVKELHIDHTGKPYEVEYLAEAGLDVADVLALRGENIGAGIDARDAAIAEAANFRVPITKIQYIRRFTSEERQAIDAAAQANASVREFMNMLNWAEDVDVGSAEVQYALAMFEQAGLIGSGRAATIGAA